jgi:hypothetical protein
LTKRLLRVKFWLPIGKSFTPLNLEKYHIMTPITRETLTRLGQFQNVPFFPISASGSNFNPRNAQCMSLVKIFALTRGIHAPRLTGSMIAFQFCYPAELPLTLNKLKCFKMAHLIVLILKGRSKWILPDCFHAVRLF